MQRQMMLSEAQIERVWQGMLGAEIRANYFAELTERYNRRQRWATWGTLFMSSGALATILIQLPSGWAWVRVVFAAIATALSLYSVVRQNNKLAVDAADLYARWNKLSCEYEKLWEDVTVDDAANILHAFTDHGRELSESARSFPNDGQAMLKWENHVLAHRLQPQT
jgi:hypothetical protein